MAKQKTKKSVLKRIKISSTGKLLRRRAGSRHLRRTKSASKKRGFRKHHELTNPRIVRRLKRLMATA